MSRVPAGARLHVWPSRLGFDPLVHRSIRDVASISPPVSEDLRAEFRRAGRLPFGGYPNHAIAVYGRPWQQDVGRSESPGSDGSKPASAATTPVIANPAPMPVLPQTPPPLQQARRPCQLYHPCQPYRHCPASVVQTAMQCHRFCLQNPVIEPPFRAAPGKFADSTSPLFLLRSCPGLRLDQRRSSEMARRLAAALRLGRRRSIAMAEALPWLANNTSTS